MWLILQRELVQLGRNRSLYLPRLLPVLLVLPIWLYRAGELDQGGELAKIATECFTAATVMASAAVALVVALWAAPALAEERERGTLPLLLLTTVRPAAIIWAKVLGRLAVAAVPMIAMFGVLSILMLLGGISPEALVRAYIGLAVQGWFYTALVVYVSTWQRHSGSAIFAGVFHGVLWTVALPLLLYAIASTVWPELQRGAGDDLFGLLMPAMLCFAVCVPELHADLVRTIPPLLLSIAFMSYFLVGLLLLWRATVVLNSGRYIWHEVGRAGGRGRQWLARRKIVPRRWRWRRPLERLLGWLLGRGPVGWRAARVNPYDQQDWITRMIVWGMTFVFVCAILADRREAALGKAALLLLTTAVSYAVEPLAAAFLLGVGATGGWVDAHAGVTAIAVANWCVWFAVALATAAGVARDRALGMTDQLAMTPVSDGAVVASQLACGVRVALPWLSVLAGGGLGWWLLSTELNGPEYGFALLEVVCDLAVAGALGMVAGYMTYRTVRAAGWAVLPAVVAMSVITALALFGDDAVRRWGMGGMAVACAATAAALWRRPIERCWLGVGSLTLFAGIGLYEPIAVLWRVDEAMWFFPLFPGRTATYEELSLGVMAVYCLMNVAFASIIVAVACLACCHLWRLQREGIIRWAEGPAPRP